MFFLKPINDMVNDFFNDSVFSYSYKPFRIDIKENDGEYQIEAELPGVRKDEIKVEYRKDQLLISVERVNKIDEEQDNYIHKERRYASMRRGIYLKNIDENAISAKLEDGILTIIAPKLEKAVNRLIEIK